MKQDQLIELSACPICSSHNLDLFLTTEDYFLSHEQFNIDYCLDCGFKFTNPRPLNEFMSEFYHSENYISHSNIKRGFINKTYHHVRKLTIKSKIKLVKRFIQIGNILDIGCGTGDFLNEIKNSGFRVTGIEPNQNARDFAKTNYNLNIVSEKDISSLNSSQFDVITMWHVLEHVYFLGERMHQLKTLLKEDGFVIIAVPNASSWDSKHYGKYWAAYDLPRHLYHFESKNLIKLFLNYRFRHIITLPMYYDSFYVSLLSEKYKTGKSNFISGILNGFYSNLAAFFTDKNYSSLIYVFKNLKDFVKSDLKRES